MKEMYCEDFTEGNYRKIIKLVKKNYYFAHYRNLEHTTKHVLWRHDLDVSVHRALKLAQIESEEEVFSTFFILLSSTFYNALEKEILEIILKIKSLGHRLGLHFDQKYCEFKNQDEFERCISSKKKFLEDITECSLDAISFHNPDFDSDLNIRKDTYSDMVNTYSPKIFNEYKYVSDSNGYWRYDRLEEVFEEPKYKKIQVLTHPEWWVKEPISPRNRMLRAIIGRKEYS